MGESSEVIDLKRKELVEELLRPKQRQDKYKIKRLQESINRHRNWERKRKQAKIRRLKNKNVKYKF